MTSNSRVLRFHSRTVWSAAPETRKRPSGEDATAHTVALMADEIAPLFAIEAIGAYPARAAARDDGFAIGRETVGVVGIAICCIALYAGLRLAILQDVENGVIAIGAALSNAQREIAKAGLPAVEGLGLCQAKGNRRAKRAVAQRQGQCMGLNVDSGIDGPPTDAPPID